MARRLQARSPYLTHAPRQHAGVDFPGFGSRFDLDETSALDSLGIGEPDSDPDAVQTRETRRNCNCDG